MSWNEQSPVPLPEPMHVGLWPDIFGEQPTTLVSSPVNQSEQHPDDYISDKEWDENPHLQIWWMITRPAAYFDALKRSWARLIHDPFGIESTTESIKDSFKSWGITALFITLMFIGIIALILPSGKVILERNKT